MQPGLDRRADRGARNGGPAPGASFVDLAVQRAFTALLRERAHRLPRMLPPRHASAARLVPALLHASFDQRPLDADAPGVAGQRYRRRWSSLARAFGLPPPCRAQRGRCLIDAVLLVPTSAEVQVLAIARAGAAEHELRAVRGRLAAIEAVLAAAGAPVRAVALLPPELSGSPYVCHRTVAFGALLAGRLSPALWEVLGAACAPLPPATTAALAAGAPDALARLALTLMTRAPSPAPLAAIASLLESGLTARHLADPETFSVRWAGLVPGLRAPLEEALSLARPPRNARGGEDRTTEADAGAQAGAAPSAEGAPTTTALFRLVEHGRALAHACAAAIRSPRVGRLDRFTRRSWREALGPGLPNVLLPALGALLDAEAKAGHLRLDPVRVERGYEVLLRDGTRLGRGANPVQARVRALGLAAAADAARRRAGDGSAIFSGLDATWRAVGQRLSRPREQPALVLVPVVGAGARPGPPLDLLNRGPERALEFDGALAVLVVPGRRPSGRMLGPEETIDAVLRRAPAGGAVEMLATHPAAQPLAARLARISGLLRDPSLAGPVAIEAGGRVATVHADGVRRFTLQRFAARPRVFTPDPDAPDISLGTGDRRRLRSPPGIVQCRAVALSESVAALLYVDGAGLHLREEVPLSELEERLRDAREIVRAAQPPAALGVRLSEDLEAALRRAAPPRLRVGVAVCGALPLVEVAIDGERFGGRSGLGWRAAAEKLLSGLPAGIDGRVGVDAVTATAGGARASPILALYASSVARRRLHTHLAHTLASYRTAAASRRQE